LSQKHSSSRSYVQARDLNCSLQVSVFAHRCAKLWNCQTHVDFTHVLGYEVIPVYVRLSDGDWIIGACRLFCSLWLQATEQSTFAHTSYFSTLQNINHLEGAIFTITQLSFVKHRQECQYVYHFVSSCIIKVTTHFFPFHSQVWQMFTMIMEALNLQCDGIQQSLRIYY